MHTITITGKTIIELAENARKLADELNGVTVTDDFSALEKLVAKNSQNIEKIQKVVNSK